MNRHVNTSRLSVLLAALAALRVHATPLAAAPTTVTKAAPEKFALLIGINEYTGKGLSKLRGCVNDARAMKASLVENFGFADDGAHIQMLLDGAATHQNIVDGFRKHLIDNSRRHPNATLVFYFSGHGSTARDQNGDEADGLDETLVPVDSTRDARDKRHFDILDDELDMLARQLRRYSSRVTFIFDSCHSGTGTRGQASASGDTRVLVKEAPPDSRVQPRVAGFLAGKPNETGTADLLMGSGETVLASCLPQESSVDANFDGRNQGALTFYLLQAMRNATRTTTNEQVWQAAARGVTLRFPTQHPQLEGRAKSLFLGGATRTAPPAIVYRFDKATRMLSFGRSILDGARPGGFVAAYAPAAGANAPKLQGRFQITSATATRAIAKVDAALDIAEVGSIELLTPRFGDAALRASLDLPPGDPIAVALRKYFAQNPLLVELAQPGDKAADVSIRRSRRENAPSSPIGRKGAIIIGDKGAISVGDKGAIIIDDKAKKLSKRSRSLSQASGAVYYISSGGRLVFGHASEARQGAQQLCLDLENMARQLNLRALSNSASRLAGTLDVRVVTVAGARKNGVFFPARGGEVELAPQRRYAFDQNQYFKIRVRNTGARAVYAAVVQLASDGGIELLRTKDNAVSMRVEPAGQATTDLYYTSAPAGVDTFKILLTSRPTDFSSLEQDATERGVLLQKAARPTLLSMMMGQAMGTRGPLQDDEPGAETGFDDWLTAQMDFDISQATLPQGKR